MSNDIKPKINDIYFNNLESKGQPPLATQGTFLGRTVVQTSPGEREANRANSKLELSELLSMHANVEIYNSILSFEKDPHSVQALLNRKIQVISQSQ
ncbi:T3SS regulon translocated regulator ExsE2 [Vibrio sp. 10N.222.54.F12]|jgi:hypothetical protein|uniref:T3SS regulon translocated regulator ExsE2 n=3 Tax=Vibrio TaxID=662 RepID=A0AB35N650_VIBSP|nr:MULTISPECIES: T3SS regulon translocated regulator ExsE2 [Vibrio]MDP2503847.1 T3SS regulon translocated regulator ExsE2 [Vibrio splendidus]OEF44669.1 hypothetical protein A163_11050 [Vibrio tasmaniensis 1F-267]OEF73086.1 hypothetical protein A152_11065 [Vibrio tasmaniensis 1F-187]PMG57144.1 hypothetical protein BCU89_02005 [Vibrio splendidus]PML18764.1 hypothetical protein BCT83_22220 [Vibrio tasmaniensis]